MKSDLLRSIIRSELAYEYYLEHRKYFQALRIYRANKEVYRLLNQYFYCCEEKILEDVINYLFHLEDWFHQFKSINAAGYELDAVFMFERLEHSLAFPRNFKSLLL